MMDLLPGNDIANPTIMVSEHITTRTLDTTSQTIPVDTPVEGNRSSDNSYKVAPATQNHLPEHVKYGRDPDGQQRSDYKHLEILLRRCGIEHADSNEGHIKLFWPTPLLERILTQDRIVEELDAPTQDDFPLEFDTNTSDLASQILDGRIKIFAVLVLLGQVQCIERALAEGLEDSHLPLQSYGERAQLYRDDQPYQPVKCFSGRDWKTHDREIFLKYQHAVDPRILEMESDGRTPKHKEFYVDAVLPFMNEMRGVQKKEREYGGFGVVSVVKIHPACHKFHNLSDSIKSDNRFALKRLLKDDLEEFQREAGNLKVFNGYAHPHMVTLLMTWKWISSYYLLFPLAKCDLDKYWENTPNKVDMDTVQWMSKQLVGISSAVSSIHDPKTNVIRHDVGPDNATLQVPHDESRYGRHGDLKPDNILLYDSTEYDQGILVVADFGLSKLNSILSRSIQSNSRVPATPRYKAPECDIDGARIKRSYDIWTFGCLSLEWVCWLFGGQSARETFVRSLDKPYPSGSRKDMFFDMLRQPDVKLAGQHGEEYLVVIKPEVEEKIAKLHEDPVCTQYFHDLLDLIEQKMIITCADDRISACALNDALTHMAGPHNDDYYATPCPKPYVVMPQAPLRVVFRRTTT